MNLSAKLVLFKLRQQLSMTTSGQISAEACLKYPILYQNTLPLRENLIYVIDDEDFFLHTKNLEQVLLLFVGNSFSRELLQHPNIAFIESEVSAARVLQLLQEIFDIYNEWTQNIFQQISAGPTVQKIIELSSEALPNQMSVMGMDFTLLGSNLPLMKELKNNVYGSTEETLREVNALKRDPNYNDLICHKEAILYPGNAISPPSLCVNIFSHGKVTHRLVIGSGMLPLDDTIHFLAEFLANIMAQIIHSMPASTDEDVLSLHHIFHTILTDPKSDYVENSHVISANGWQISHYYQCVLIQIGTLDRKNLTLKSICGYVENTIPESCAIDLSDHIVVYINLNLTSLTLDEIMQKLAGFIRDNLLMASYSRKMMGHFNFYRQYQQARLTMQLGAKKNPTAWVHHFNDIALPYFMEQLTKKLPAYMICHEKLLQLKYMDENNDSQLYQTLRCYLENQQSPTKTAQAMYIHRSTLLYRLERIRSFLKSDLSDPDELLYLMLSYRLMEEEERHDL